MRTKDGKTIIYIDGQPYSVSIPTGGIDEKDKNNDWDRALAAGCKIRWASGLSWCSDKVTENTRVSRGFFGERFRYCTMSSGRHPYIGLRPVLVPLDKETLEPDYTLYKGSDGECFSFGTLTRTSAGIQIKDSVPGNLIEWTAFDGKLISVELLESKVARIPLPQRSRWGG